MTDLVPLTPAEQRKELLRLQLELRRQQIRLETLIVMQPLRKVQRFSDPLQCSRRRSGPAEIDVVHQTGALRSRRSMTASHSGSAVCL